MHLALSDFVKHAVHKNGIHVFSNLFTISGANIVLWNKSNVEILLKIWETITLSWNKTICRSWNKSVWRHKVDRLSVNLHDNVDWFYVRKRKSKNMSKYEKNKVMIKQN